MCFKIACIFNSQRKHNSSIYRMKMADRHLDSQIQQQQPISNKSSRMQFTSSMVPVQQPVILWWILSILIIGNVSVAFLMVAFGEKIDSRLSQVQTNKSISNYLQQIEAKLKNFETKIDQSQRQLKEGLGKLQSAQSAFEKSLTEGIKLLSAGISKNEKYMREGLRQVAEAQSKSSQRNSTSRKIEGIADFKGEKLQKKISGERQLHKNLTTKEAFNVVYQYSIWDATGQYPSGGGSIPEKNIDYLMLVQFLIDSPEINKIVEVGFGDFHLASTYRLREEKTWIGYDVVPSLLRPNEGNRLFKLMDDIYSFKEEGDLLIEKDVIQHWPTEAVEYFHEQIIPRFKYALITNDYYVTKTERNKTNYGQYNPLNVDEKRKHILVLDHTGGQLLKRTYLYPGWPK